MAFRPSAASGPQSAKVLAIGPSTYDPIGGGRLRDYPGTVPAGRGPNGGRHGRRELALKEAVTKTDGFREILERSEAELDRVLRNRDGIAIEKSADQMDEIQYASERDLAIRNVDRESRLLLQVRAALRRIRDGSFGTCIDCESAISPKRLSAVPSAPRCIECQAAVYRGEHEGTESLGETLMNSM
jgi:DnaK suppressor protein